MAFHYGKPLHMYYRLVSLLVPDIICRNQGFGSLDLHVLVVHLDLGKRS